MNEKFRLIPISIFFSVDFNSSHRFDQQNKNILMELKGNKRTTIILMGNIATSSNQQQQQKELQSDQKE
ncbi:hypothetical protein DERP_005925 [Dermatophagoides pteronyssinus]|uniref:Uncharacterized protein n=1 Tax=Dermatophagoides pteronyssinus TaxID=6956 RepID=A0ABQ8JSE7_DERPT|nr:hypothetical protein DERP_005925 [Dermatophagoides pteronyssinus]